MNFVSNLLSNGARFSRWAVLLAAVLMLWQPLDGSCAESRLKALSAAERERAIRLSLFAPDNPEHMAAASLQPPAMDRGAAAADPLQPAKESHGADGYGAEFDRGTGRRERQPSNSRVRSYQQQIPQGQSADEPTVAIESNGNVRVRSGNTSIDRSVESFIDGKVRSAQNAFRNLWR